MVRHISKLNVKAFRGIKNLCLDDLSLINIIVGSNNCGKTSLLEAIKVMENPEDLGSILRVASGRRGINNDNFLRVATSIFQDTEDGFLVFIALTFVLHLLLKRSKMRYFEAQIYGVIYKRNAEKP